MRTASGVGAAIWPDPIAPPSQELLRGRHDGIGGNREYRLFIPSEQRRTRLPLIVMLHGCHQNADDFALGTRMNLHAQLNRCFVVYPAQSAQANSAKCWNWYEAAHQQRELGEPAIIADLTRHLIATHRIADHQVFIAGFSAGAAMAATMAVTYPELYAALGIHSGVPHGAARDFMSATLAMQHGVMASYASHPLQGQIPTIVFHGDADSMVHATHATQFMAKARPHARMEEGEQFTETTGPEPGRYGYTRTVQLDPQRRVFSEKWIVHGGGHAWYGGDATGTYIDAYGPDATKEMMRFFIDRKR